MTFDPQHDYEDERTAKVRLSGKLQEDCTCTACQLAGVGQGSDGKLLMPGVRIVDGRKEFIGRWRHGFELKRELAERRRMFETMKQSIVGQALVER